ncbi:hypothetical protein T11_14286 [Trichinella zimbabwensis]|uniref:Uncharacterized protein n=1 Tax=Trichinella zimbabwensis TaxID=268475 RepID=A0A0V1GA20_9BILA|nr:hypothetical protein T11_14286 [Trichinella zimbabwensis]
MKCRNNCYLNKSFILAIDIGDSKYAARNGVDMFFVVWS